MMQACNYVIIPEAGDDRDNIRYVGPVVRQAGASRDALRRQFGFNKSTILVSTGGTDAGRYLIEKAIEAHRRLHGRLDSELVIVSGRRSCYPTLRIPDRVCRQLHELVCAADLVISLAGRSTMDESIAYGTPGIFIPIKGHFEQEEGAARLGFKHEDIFRLESLIEEKLGRRNDVADAGGAEKAAKLISTLTQ